LNISKPQNGHSEERCAWRCILLSATGCLDYERKYEFFTRNEIGAGAKYFQDSTDNFAKRKKYLAMAKVKLKSPCWIVRYISIIPARWFEKEILISIRFMHTHKGLKWCNEEWNR